MLAGRLGGDTVHCRWGALTALFTTRRARCGPCTGFGTPTAYSATWEIQLFPAYLNHIMVIPHRFASFTVRLTVPSLISDQTLIRSRHHLSLSVSRLDNRCRSILLPPTHCLLRHARFQFFLSPRHDLFWLPDVFPCSLL